MKVSLIIRFSARLSTVQATLQARRGAIVRSLDRIFPVEPISSADLLFSILDVALPIPVNSSDPTPPLSDTKWPNINEESIATALGYSAQIVQFLAAYMGYLIPYPITYAGSRSLIRDPISTMHGPRMLAISSSHLQDHVSLITWCSGNQVSALFQRRRHVPIRIRCLPAQ